MAPEEMETLVTFPIESAINGAAGVRRVRSATAVGIAVVWVEFDWGTDIFVARQIVAEKLALVGGSLPPQVERPVLAPISSIMGEILFFAISSDTDESAHAAHDRRHHGAAAAAGRAGRLAGDADRRRRAAVPGHRAPGRAARQPGLADASCSRPCAAPARTRRPASSPRARRSTCSRRSAGSARPRTSATPSSPCAATARSWCATWPRSARARRFKRGEGSRSGKPAVIVGVQKQPGANTVELTARLDRELDALQQELPAGMTIDRRIFRQADFIEVAVDNVVAALRDGGILVVLVVLLFLANLRAAAITLTAMPLSLAAAVLVLRAFGATINTMTLGGMAIAIGALVDDAIIDVENVVRRLRENHAQARGRAAAGGGRGPRRDAGDPHLDRRSPP